MSKFENGAEPDFSLNKMKSYERPFPSVAVTNVFILCLTLFYFATSVGVSLGIVSFGVYEKFETDATFYYLINAIFEMIYLGIPLAVMLLIYKKEIPSLLRLNPLSVKEIVFSVIIGIFVFFANIYLTQANYVIADMIKPVVQPAQPDPISLSDKITFMIMLIAVAPIMEELVLRGVIQRGLEGKSKWFSIIVTGTFFGLLHLGYYSFIPKILAGIFFCYVVYITDSIYASMIMHIINNGITGLITIATTGMEVSDEVVQEATMLDNYVTIAVSLVIGIGFVFVIIALTKLLKASSAVVSENGMVYKGAIRNKMYGENTSSWYVYIPLALALLLLARYIVLEVVLY